MGLHRAVEPPQPRPLVGIDHGLAEGGLPLGVGLRELAVGLARLGVGGAVGDRIVLAEGLLALKDELVRRTAKGIGSGRLLRHAHRHLTPIELGATAEVR